MERQRPAADRIRPILEAMERSIDSARRKRCNSNDRPATPRPASPPTTSSSVNGTQPSGTNTSTNVPSSDLPRPSGGDDSPPRLKARPKRPLNLNSNNSTNNWRTAS